MLHGQPSRHLAISPSPRGAHMWHLYGNTLRTVGAKVCRDALASPLPYTFPKY